MNVSWRIVDSGRNASISMMLRPERQVCVGCVDADLIDMPEGKSYWWLARCKVYPKYRRQGIGRKMLSLLAEQVKARGFPIVVSPGGYDLTEEEQRAFYRACGFKDQKDGSMRLEV